MRQNGYTQYDNLEAAAEAAAEAAKKAIAAAEVAALKHFNRRHTFHNTSNMNFSKNEVLSELPKNTIQSSFTHGEEDERKVSRRHSYNNPRAYSDIKFDDSGSDKECSDDSAPSRPPPAIPPSDHQKYGNSAARTHPNLPDYESLAARFEALKYSGK